MQGVELRTLLPLFLGHLGNVQLVTECTSHRNMGTGMQRRNTTVAMVIRHAHMGSHGAKWIHQCGSLLDQQALDGIHIVRSPDLGAVIQHTGIETATAAGAVFQQQLREFLYQPLLQVIKAQNIAVIEFPHSLCRQCRAADIRHGAVHIPLQICNVRAVQNGRHRFENMIPDILPCHVQHILMSGHVDLSTRDLDRPVGMGAVQLRIRRHHLRFHPDTELDALRIDLIRQLLQAAGQLLLVHEPIAQTAFIIVTVTKPAVIHHQHLDAGLLRLPGDAHQFFFIEVKVGSFPVVDQNGALPVQIRTADQMFAVQVMEGTGHSADTLVGVHQHRLRRIKPSSGLQQPLEAIRMDAHGQTQGVQMIQLRLGAEITGIHQIDAVDISLLLVCAGTCNHHKRMILMACPAGQRINRKLSLCDGSFHHIALSGPCTVERGQFIILIGYIQTGAHDALKVDPFFSLIDHCGTAQQSIRILKNAVAQNDLQAQIGVSHGYFQSLSIVAKGGRQTGQ